MDMLVASQKSQVFWSVSYPEWVKVIDQAWGLSLPGTDSKIDLPHHRVPATGVIIWAKSLCESPESDMIALSEIIAALFFCLVHQRGAEAAQTLVGGEGMFSIRQLCG